VTPRFESVYSSEHGVPITLEAVERLAADGSSYRHHRLVVAEGRPGAVVVAVHGDEILLVQSERPAAQAVLWELPRGIGEPGESATETALRELREETGLHAVSAKQLGDFLTDSSVFPQRVIVVACTVDDRDRRSAPDGEVRDQRWVPVVDIPGLVRDGTLRDALTLAAITIHSTGEGP